jgi:hypothetical protein
MVPRVGQKSTDVTKMPYWSAGIAIGTSLGTPPTSNGLVVIEIVF